MLAKALANKTDVLIIPVKATQLIGEYVGDGARQIHSFMIVQKRWLHV